MSRLVPENWMPECQMDGVVAHWTAGAYKASDLDREHYHILIENDGRLVRGDHSIEANVSTNDADGYAAHTGRHNTRKIGVAVCCMAEATEAPFSPGPFPMTKVQWDTLAVVIADLLDRYRIPINRQSVCGHGAVYHHYGQPNPRGKWDPLKLPWEPRTPKLAVDDQLRENVRLAQRSVKTISPNALPLNIAVNEQLISDDCFIEVGADKQNYTWMPLRQVVEAINGFPSRKQVPITIVDTDRATVLLSTPAGPKRIAFQIKGNTGFVKVKEFTDAFAGIGKRWDAGKRTVHLDV